MQTVRLVEGPTLWPYIRQSPNHDGIFGQTRFLFGPGPEPADWLAVLNEIPGGHVLQFAPERTLFLSGEPRSVRSFHPEYLAQFGTVVTTDREMEHPNRLLLPPAVPWHVGINSRDPKSYPAAMTFAELDEPPAKLKLCSCICSNKAYTPGHRVRLAFVKRLRKELGHRIDFYGRGFKEISDKEQALGPYRYHIALENSVGEDYWTEKLGDALLRNCFPIYSGAPNVTDYFDPAALCTIDIGDPFAAIGKIAQVLDSDIDTKSGTVIGEAKRRILCEYNLLAVIDRLATAAVAVGAPVGERRPILPESAFLPPVRPKLRKRALAGAIRLVESLGIGTKSGAKGEREE